VAEGVAGAVVVVAVDAAGATECAEPSTSPQALRLTAASAARPARARVWVRRDIGASGERWSDASKCVTTAGPGTVSAAEEIDTQTGQAFLTSRQPVRP
jgi:hypothetical protein